MNGENDDENLMLHGNTDSVDCVNREFYARFPYPWPPITFPKLEDPSFELTMLNQSLGSYTHNMISKGAKIWVAGCGTNQAVYTCLRFPASDVVGSDISPTSLELCLSNARSLNIHNLTLRDESLNNVSYDQQFDYIICTGVIHHNADPSLPLSNIKRALRPGGVLELMVYNRFHRLFYSSFQKAVRTIARFGGRTATYDEELELARAFAASEAIAPRAAATLSLQSAESQIADALIQPLEFSYTVLSLSELAVKCGLELLLPCYSQVDASSNRSWTIRLSSKVVQERVDSLPAVTRWHIANLLLQETSPMLWFYLRRQEDNETGIDYEKFVNQSFLKQRFVRASTTLRNYVRGSSNLNYRLSPRAINYPFEIADGLPNEVVKRSNGRHTMGDTLNDLGIDIADHKTVTDIRMQTTTSLRPFLRAV